LHKLATIHASTIARHLGNLPNAQKTNVATKLRSLLAAW